MTTSTDTRDQDLPESANDTFKRQQSSFVSLGLILAVAVHFAFFTLFPRLHAADLTGIGGEIEALNLPPEVRIPPPPQQIARPATPRVAAAEVSEDVTIAPTTFEANPAENLPPPPRVATASPDDRPTFIPFDTPPRLLNPDEIRTALARLYPDRLREAGVEGSVVLWIYVDSTGSVRKSHVQTGSGYDAMDRVAQEIVERMRFAPAKNRDKTTPVWVAQRIAFEVG